MQHAYYKIGKQTTWPRNSTDTGARSSARQAPSSLTKEENSTVPLSDGLKCMEYTQGAQGQGQDGSMVSQRGTEDC